MASKIHATIAQINTLQHELVRAHRNAKSFNATVDKIVLSQIFNEPSREITVNYELSNGQPYVFKVDTKGHPVP